MGLVMTADFAANLLILAAFMFGAACLFGLCGVVVWLYQRYLLKPRNRYLTQREYEQLIKHFEDNEPRR